MTVRSALLAVVVLSGLTGRALAQWHSIFPQGIDLSPDPAHWVPPDGVPDYWVNAELYTPSITVAALPKGYGDLVTITNNLAIPLDNGTLAVARLAAFYGDPAKHISLLDMVANPAGLTNGTTAAYPVNLPPNQTRSVEVDMAPGIGALLQPAPEYRILFWLPESSPIGVWNSSVNGNWSTAGNWTGGPPDAAGATATLNAATPAPLTVKLDNPQTVGTLQFGNPASATAGYTLDGSGTNTLTLDNSGSGVTIIVSEGTHAIDAPVILADNLAITGSGTSPWILAFGPSSGITQNFLGDYTLTMSGDRGTLILSGSDSYRGGTIVAAGTLEVTDPAALPDAGSLTIGAGAASIFGAAVARGTTADAPAAVPEPSTLVLLGAGGVGFAVSRRLRRRRWDAPSSDRRETL
jgi:autotransporter-associated beta strand protein